MKTREEIERDAEVTFNYRDTQVILEVLLDIRDYLSLLGLPPEMFKDGPARSATEALLKERHNRITGYATRMHNPEEE